jgi:light-regulated signal transduction histidine kinase (bacteriophytochrome)
MYSVEKHNKMQSAFEQEKLLHVITNRIRRSLDLKDVLAVTVVEACSFLNIDRVMIYRFDADESGEVVAESIQEQRLPSLLGLHFPADDIPKTARIMFLEARQRSIVNVRTKEIGLSPFPSGSSSSEAPIQYRQVESCHLEYLKAMGVESSLVLPILHQNPTDTSTSQQLWGLLVAHHSQPRTISTQELQIMQQVADQVSIAIAQSNLIAQTREEQQRAATINQITIFLHSLPTIDIQSALKTTVAAFGASGGRLYIESNQELYTWGSQPKLPGSPENAIIEEHPVWQSWIAELNKEDVWAIGDLYREPQLRVLASAFLETKIRGLLVIRLYCHQQFIGTITIFRNEYDTEILWAGKRNDASSHSLQEYHNPQQLLPQISFDAWCEQRKGQAKAWESTDIALATALVQHFSMAIQQHLTYKKVEQMYQQVQELNQNLESKVKIQTAELEKSLLLTQVIKQVSEQIRSTLNLQTTLQTIVQEIRHQLDTDRVVIFQFSENNGGKVIVEELKGNNQSVIGIGIPPGCFPEDYNQKYLNGRIKAINDVALASLTPCHREFLESLQIQANLIVPIKMGSQLWGLLIAHQCQTPRNWQDDEIELLEQLASQASIAIQQAELYEASLNAKIRAKAKANELKEALDNLKKTQAQLIQTEKMSSLGQLVAGVAHELNNPVNFIHGNLYYSVEYIHKILELLETYQNNYPQPIPEIESKIEEIDRDFVMQDLPKIMSSMMIGTDRIRSIVLSLRNFSRLDESEMKAVNIHEGIDNTLLILQHKLKSNQEFSYIQIQKNYGNIPLVECYAGQLNQVFMNILSNAIDAVFQAVINKTSDYQPIINIISEINTNSDGLIIRIADNGIGMKEHIKNKIFDPFFTTKEVGKGTGLGLAISYQIIVTQHQGTIMCLSDPDIGTEFWIQIPLKQQS